MRAGKAYTINGRVITKYRKREGFNQTEFWRLFGVSQSGGSRIENGSRRLSKPMLAEMIRVIVYAQPSCEHILRNPALIKILKRRLRER